MRQLTLLFVFVLLVGCAETAVTPPPTISPENRYFDSPEYGLHLSQWWRIDDAYPRDLQATKDLGFGWVKQSISWRNVEGHNKGEYDWYRPDQIVQHTEDAGLKLLVRIDRQPLWSALPYLSVEERITENQPPYYYEDFGDFCGVLAERYKGRIAAYQVWNEPNLDREWGEKPPNPVEYTELLKVCYEAIKAHDPEAIVISAGLAPTGTQPPDAMPDTDFLQGMYDAGAAEYFDVLGVNAPGFKAPPTLPPEEGEKEEWGNGRWFVFRHVEDIREIMVQNGDGDKQVAILEMGWVLQQDIHESYEWHGVTEEQQAEYLVGAYEYAKENWQPWIGLMTTLYLADADWNPQDHEQYWWAINLPDGTPRPAYWALQAMEK